MKASLFNIILFLLIATVISSCGNGSFYSQKFTHLNQLTANTNSWSTDEIEDSLRTISAGNRNIHTLLKLSIKDSSALYIQTEDALFIIERPVLNEKNEDVCGPKLTAVTAVENVDKSAIIYSSNDDIGEDNCIYLSDIDEVLYKNIVTNHSIMAAETQRDLTTSELHFPVSSLIGTAFFLLLFALANKRLKDLLANGSLVEILIYSWLLFTAMIALGILVLVFFIFFLINLAKYQEAKTF